MRDAGCVPDVRVFRRPGSVFGARCSASALIRCRVSGPRCWVPGTQQGNKAECLAHASKNAPTGYANPVCAFSSVLGVRPSALIRSRVPGARYPGPGTRYQVPVFKKPAHGVCKMQDRKGAVPACATWVVTLMDNPHLRILHGRVGMESIGRRAPFRDPGMGKELRRPEGSRWVDTAPPPQSQKGVKERPRV